MDANSSGRFQEHALSAGRELPQGRSQAAEPLQARYLPGSAVHHSAYMAGEKVRDPSTGQISDYSSRATHIKHTEMVLGPEFSATDRDKWSRQKIWSDVDAHRTAKGDGSGRIYFLKLPAQLGDEAHIDLTYQLAQYLIKDHKKGAVDISIHSPRPGRPQFSYAQLLTTDMKVTPAGVSRDGLSGLSSGAKQRLDIGRNDPELKAAREHWAKIENEAILDAEARNDTRRSGTDISNPTPTARAIVELRDYSKKMFERTRSNQTELPVEPEGKDPARTKGPARDRRGDDYGR